MTLRTKVNASVCGALALGLVATAQPAEARWIFHNEAVGEVISAPAGGTRAQSCSTRLKAVAGYGAFMDFEKGDDPATFTIPAEAKTTVDYEVWRAPANHRNFDGAIEDFGTNTVYFEDADGTHQATLVARVTTPRRKALRTPEPTSGKRNQTGTFVFTSAAISVRLRGVKPGDALGLRPKDHTGFVNATAIDCRLAVLKAKVDVIPGSKANTVRPDNGNELIPVRIYGSKRLRVKRIKEVHLGDASKPAPVPADLKSKVRPKDVNRDGRLDRLYYFRQGDTGIMCIDTSVKVTGRTSDKKRFQAKAPIRTAGCDG